MPPPIPTPVDHAALSEAQCAGMACVWCGRPLLPLSRRHVGYRGVRRLYGCGSCAATKRLPVWPETGSA